MFKNSKNILFLSAIIISCLVVRYFETTKKTPTYGEIFNKLGLKCEKNCPPHEQIKYFQRALKYKPTLFNAYYHIGRVYEQIGDIKNEEAYYQKTIAQVPSHYDANFQMGLNAFQQRDLKKANEYFHFIWQIHKYDPPVNYYLGRIAQINNELDEAWSRYKNACDYDSDFAYACVRFGMVDHLLKYGFAQKQVQKLRNLKEEKLANQLQKFINDDLPFSLPDD